MSYMEAFVDIFQCHMELCCFFGKCQMGVRCNFCCRNCFVGCLSYCCTEFVPLLVEGLCTSYQFNVRISSVFCIQINFCFEFFLFILVYLFVQVYCSFLFFVSFMFDRKVCIPGYVYYFVITSCRFSWCSQKWCIDLMYDIG